MGTFRFLILMSASASLLAESASFRYRQHPHPDFAVDAIAEGPNGCLWLAGPSGLHRFDGLRFTPIAQYPFSSARWLAPAPDGSLWIGSTEGLVRFQQRFEIMRRESVLGLAAAKDATYARTASGLIRIDANGRVTPLAPMAHSRLHVDGAGSLWYTGPNGGYLLKKGATQAELVSAFPPAPPGDFRQLIPDREGRLWFGRRNTALSPSPYTRLNRTGEVAGTEISSLFAGPTGQVWYLGDSIRGLSPAIHFDVPRPQKGAAFRAGMEDRRGHLWFDSDDRQLMEAVPEEGWDRWSKADLGGHSVRHLAREAAGTLIAVTEVGAMRLNPATKQWSNLPGPPGSYTSLIPQPDGSMVAAVRGLGVVHLSAAGRVIQILEGLANGRTARDEYQTLHQDQQNRIWVGSAGGLFRLDKRNGRFTISRVLLPGEGTEIAPPRPVQVIALEQDALGRMWAGSALGAAWLDSQDRWHPVATSKELGLIRSLAVDVAPTNGAIWAAYRSAGIFSRITQVGDQWQTQNFLANDGYLPDRTTMLKGDSRGWIWRGTEDGVQVADGTRLGVNDWLHLDSRNGMTTSLLSSYGFLEDPDGGVWLSGDGITHMKPRSDWFGPPADGSVPRVTVKQVNEQTHFDDERRPESFSEPLRRLRLEVASLGVSPFRVSGFIYRLKPTMKGWREARDGVIDLRDLSAQNYQLEVAYAGYPVKIVKSYAFHVGSPWPGPWTGAGVSGALLALWGLRRTIWMQRLHYLSARYLHRRKQPIPISAASTANRTGAVLAGRYRLEALMAQGGFAKVYRANDLSNDQPVAVKILDRSTSEAAWVKQRFTHEVAALQAMNHPGVLPLIDSWLEPDGHPCLVTPWLDGPTLRTAMDAATLPLERIAWLTTQVAEALHETHQRGVVHRDLKPENILLVSGQPVLIDFGNAGLVGRDEGLSKTTLLGGSIYYMAPEQFSMHYAPSSDLYALAIIILELLCGKRLADLSYAAASSNFQAELVKALRVRGMENVIEVAGKLGEAFHSDPSQRPADAATWARAMADLLLSKPNEHASIPPRT